MYAGMLTKMLRLLSHCSTKVFAATTMCIASFYSHELQCCQHNDKTRQGVGVVPGVLVEQVLAEHREGMQHFGGALLHVINSCGYPCPENRVVHLWNALQVCLAVCGATRRRSKRLGLTLCVCCSIRFAAFRGHSRTPAGVPACLCQRFQDLDRHFHPRVHGSPSRRHDAVRVSSTPRSCAHFGVVFKSAYVSESWDLENPRGFIRDGRARRHGRTTRGCGTDQPDLAAAYRPFGLRKRLGEKSDEVTNTSRCVN